MSRLSCVHQAAFPIRWEPVVSRSVWRVWTHRPISEKTRVSARLTELPRAKKSERAQQRVIPSSFSDLDAQPAFDEPIGGQHSKRQPGFWQKANNNSKISILWASSTWFKPFSGLWAEPSRLAAHHEPPNISSAPGRPAIHTRRRRTGEAQRMSGSDPQGRSCDLAANAPGPSLKCLVPGPDSVNWSELSGSRVLWPDSKTLAHQPATPRCGGARGHLRIVL